MKKIYQIYLTVLLMFFSTLGSATIFEHEYVKSPHFVIKQEGALLNLYKNKVNAEISGNIADVKVTQHYKNEGEQPIEAIFVFPASPSAAVYGVTLNVNGRVTEAAIKEKQDAKQTYEAAKKEGKSASLLVQDGPNTFTMNVSNILPGDDIQVQLSYVEQLVITNGQYQFHYPISVGPKYASTDTPAIPKDIKNEFSVNIISALPVSSINTKHHSAKVTRLPGKAEVKADFSSSKKPFILEYSLRGETFTSELQTFDGGDEQYFMLMVQPPKTPRVESLLPREYIFIVDVSGSMDGMPTETCKKMMAELLYKLTPADRFNIIQFAGGQDSLFDNAKPVSDNSLDAAFEFIENADGYGGTEILPALEQALKSKKPLGYSRSIIVMTDGLVNVEKEAFDLVRNNLNNANLFSFGVYNDYGVNEYIIKGLARIGQTDPILINDDKDIEEMVSMFVEYISEPLLSDIHIDFGQLEPYEINADSYGDIYSQRPLIVSGKYKGDLDSPIVIKGHTVNGGHSETVHTISADNPAIKYLWAREQLKTLTDYDGVTGSTDKLKKAITEIGLKYNLLTEYTSFVAVDQVIRNASGELTQATQNMMPTQLSSGFGFDEEPISVPISKVIPEHKTISNINFSKVQDIWVQNGLELKDEALSFKFSIKDLQCLSNKHAWLKDILLKLNDVLVQVESENIRFSRQGTGFSSCQSIVNALSSL